MKTENRKMIPTVEKDRNTNTLELMQRMKLYGMASAFRESLSSTFAESMTPDNFVAWLLSNEWDYRTNTTI